VRGFAVAAVSGALAIFALGSVVCRITGGLLAVTWPAERDGVQIARVAGRSRPVRFPAAAWRSRFGPGVPFICSG
jgi:hypothetical protein